MTRTIVAALAFALVGAASAKAADEGVHVGVLTCKMTDSTNLVLYSNQKFDCAYKSDKGHSEEYVGRIDKIGADLSIKQDFTLIWAVMAPTADRDKEGALRGHYVGVAADAALGVGGGAKVLVGGGENHIALQPVGVTGVKGVGVSVGIQRFSLN
ncbi:MAG: DUF992 domain-containing protein [Geminicoccaceae bacterium]